MKSKLVLLGTVAVLSVCAAQQSSAHHHQGWYVGLEGGANWVDDNDAFFDTGNPPTPPALPISIDFDTGWAGLGTVGYAFDNNWRIEGELGYRQNDANWFVGRNPRTGDLTELTAMVNLLYDVPLSERLDLNLGVGAGADYSNFDDNAFVDDHDTNFAYQGIAGLTYALTDRLDLTLTYRYLHVNEPDYSGARPVGFDTYAFEDLEKHTATVGLRYDLYEDEAPPPPMAPPAPPPPPPPEADSFVIFFGFNKCNITLEADQVLGEAAAAAKSRGSASVHIEGHTDTVGSNKYNQRLSECRSGAAKSNLVGKGVPESAITTVGKGETDLLVKTGDNIKEPQNRRATIDLH